MVLWLLDSEDVQYYQYNLVGCQPATGTVGDLDASTADPLKPAIGIFFDYFTRKSLRHTKMGHPGSGSPFQPHPFRTAISSAAGAGSMGGEF